MKKLILMLVVLCVMCGIAQGVVELKQGTSVTLKFGPMLDAIDGVTAETALVSHAAHIELAKNGGNIAAKNDATTTAHDEDGYYDVVLDATDTGTLGVLLVTWTDANAVPAWQSFAIVTANYWDSKYSTDIFDVSVTQWLGTAAATPTTAGVPEVDITFIDGSAVPVTTATLISDSASINARTTTVASATSARSITLTAGTPVVNAHRYMILTITDADDNTSIESRVIINWSAGRVAIVDEPFSFTPTGGDIATIAQASYFKPIQVP